MLNVKLNTCVKQRKVKETKMTNANVNANASEIPNTAPLEVAKPKLAYPYTDTEALQQLVLHISRADHGLIKCIRPRQGTLTIVAAMLWHKLCNACRERGILDMSSEDQFESFFAESVIISAEEYEQLRVESTAYQAQRAIHSNSPLAPLVPLTPVAKKVSKKKVTE